MVMRSKSSVNHLPFWPRGHVRHRFQRSATDAMTMTTLEALLLLLSPIFSRLRYIVAMLHALVKLKLKRQLGRSGQVRSGTDCNGCGVHGTRRTEYGATALQPTHLDRPSARPTTQTRFVLTKVGQFCLKQKQRVLVPRNAEYLPHTLPYYLTRMQSPLHQDKDRLELAMTLVRLIAIVSSYPCQGERH